MSEFDRMLKYCNDLAANNNRPWFHEHHKEYELACKDFLNLLDLMRFSVAECAPALARDILSAQAKDWTYRIPRDARMHKDRPPYNPSFRAYISADRKSWKPIGYFIMISPAAPCFGTGVWCRDGSETAQVRYYILRHWDALAEALENSTVTVTGDALKRMPRGFEAYADHPAAPYIRMKNWSMIAPLSPDDFTDLQTFDAAVRSYVKQIEPFRLFLLDALSGSEMSADVRQVKKLQQFYDEW